RHYLARIAGWLLFGGLALASLGGLFSNALLEWIDNASWSLVFLAGWLPMLVFEVVLLGRYLRRAAPGPEKARARIVLVALAIGGSFSMSDVAHGAGLGSPYLGAVGTLISSGLLATLVVRFELFDRNISARTAIYVLGMMAAFIVAYFVVLSALAGRVAV